MPRVAATGMQRDNLGRLMRYLASEGVLSVDQDGCCAPTPAGEGLTSGVNGSLRDLALVYGGFDAAGGPL